MTNDIQREAGRMHTDVRFTLSHPTVQFHVSVKMDLNEMTQTLNSEQITAVMQGIAKLLAAQNAK